MGCDEADIFDGNVVSRGTLPAGYSSHLLHIDECFMLLCMTGGMQVELSGQRHTLPLHSLLVSPANSVLRIMCPEGSSFICMIPTSGYLSRHCHCRKQLLPLMWEIRGKNVIPLSETEASRYEHISDCVIECMRCRPLLGWAQDALASGMRMLFCTVLAKIKEFAEGMGSMQEAKPMNRGEEYFSRFLGLLSVYYRQERKIGFYASRLCVTPKYLSAVVKEASGKTPGKWIDEMVMDEIYCLLRDSTIPIKEIAYRMNFANRSFFGKYVKRYTGVSPHYYRTCETIYGRKD